MLNPKLRCLFMSGDTDDIIVSHGVLDTGVLSDSAMSGLYHLSRWIRLAKTSAT